MRELSSHFLARRPTLEDAEGILVVGIARDIEDLGYPDYSLDDVREELGEADDALVVDAAGGGVVASALRRGGDAQVLVHPSACGNGLGSGLRERIEQGARESGEPVIRQSVQGANDAARRLLEHAGYEAVQRYWRMVRDLDGDLDGPSWPEGVEARPYARDADDVTAHALVREAFAEIPGNVDRDLEDWRAIALGGAQFAPDLSTVVLAGEEPAGVAVCQRWEDGQGYVAYLAVMRDHRGRGLGRALLAESLAKMRAAGLTAAALNVNGRNDSATRLYESVGMRVGSRAERYDKQLRA